MVGEVLAWHAAEPNVVEVVARLDAAWWVRLVFAKRPSLPLVELRAIPAPTHADPSLDPSTAASELIHEPYLQVVDRDLPVSLVARLSVPAVRRHLADVAQNAIDNVPGQVPAAIRLIAGSVPSREFAALPPTQRRAVVAAAYLEELRNGPKGIAQRVGERLNLSPGAVRTCVHHARRDGLLTPAQGSGRAGGELTEYGRQVLEGLD